MGSEQSDQLRQPQFSAFLSYAHADAAFVRKLHSKLEAYRLPRGLGYVGASNGGKRRLGRVFRDREDLSAAESLSDAITDALGRSKTLVVVCSPEAKASRWVREEIEHFQNRHPDRPILAALIRGEPEDAFPDALTQNGTEPLAADLREEGDGWKLGFLKIVAGIAGVPLDALIQRDAQRKARRVMAVTGASLFAALVMGVMTTIAIQARNEAQFQQAEAESLVEFMLTDLRKELKGVGRLGVMTDVNQRAMDFYKNQDLDNLSADGLERRARILHAMGEDEVKLGDIDGATEKFTEAHRITQTLLDRDPNNADRIFGHAQSVYWVGFIGHRNQDWAITRRYWTVYEELGQKLLTIAPDKPKWVREAGYGAGNLCTLELLSGGSLDAALNHCQAAIDHFSHARELSRGDPSSTADLANRYAWLGEVFEARGEREKELAARLAGEKLVAQLVRKDPQNLDWKDLWVVTEIAIAGVELSLGNEVNARRRLADAQKDINYLISADPKNTSWRSRQEMIDKFKNTN